jgi:hypothetical protein
MKKLQTPSTGFYDISDRDNGELIVRLKEMLIIIINGEQILEISLFISWPGIYGEPVCLMVYSFYAANIRPRTSLMERWIGFTRKA